MNYKWRASSGADGTDSEKALLHCKSRGKDSKMGKRHETTSTQREIKFAVALQPQVV